MSQNDLVEIESAHFFKQNLRQTVATIFFSGHVKAGKYGRIVHLMKHSLCKAAPFYLTPPALLLLAVLLTGHNVSPKKLIHLTIAVEALWSPSISFFGANEHFIWDHVK